VPATFRSKGEHVRIARLELRRKPVTMPLTILWDSNKPLPRFAENFPELFSAHATALMREGKFPPDEGLHRPKRFAPVARRGPDRLRRRPSTL
jgi:hypothetical protein